MVWSSTKMSKAIAWAALVLMLFAAVAIAYTPIPESYWGTAKLDGEAAPSGLSVTAKVTGTSEVVGSSVTEEEGGFSLDVVFDNSGTPEDEGADEDDSLTWYIEGNECSSPAPGEDTANSGGINLNFVIEADSGGECACNGDESPCDSVVDDFELLHYIVDWSAGYVEDFDLLYAINYWAGAWVCP